VSSVGSYVNRFEQSLASYVGAKHGIATVNGTAALHLALLVAGVQPDDEVLVSAVTFIAPVNAIHYAGAHPVFIDAEPNYYQMDVQKAADFLAKECVWREGALYNKTTGRRIAALLPVHILGHPVEMAPLVELARQYELPLVEDASESLGAKYQGQMVGHIGDIACFSFNGNKLITTGGGGMITTDNDAWAEKARYLATQVKDDPLEYVHHEIGYNYRLTNIQAAMGCAQVEQLPAYIAKKRQIAAAYTAAFADTSGITPMPEAPWAFSSFWLYTILVDEIEFGMDSRALLRYLEEKKIQTRPLWHPIYSLKPYKTCPAYHITIADKLYARALSIPCSVGLKNAEQERVIEGLLGSVQSKS
ncbi:MAG: LegC family aminotransferase, partial [Anaerolineales bacterium]|nr:LegC family aminotransferase [Anaerolineales bacterium]